MFFKNKCYEKNIFKLIYPLIFPYNLRNMNRFLERLVQNSKVVQNIYDHPLWRLNKEKDKYIYLKIYVHEYGKDYYVSGVHWNLDYALKHKPIGPGGFYYEDEVWLDVLVKINHPALHIMIDNYAIKPCGSFFTRLLTPLIKYRRLSIIDKCLKLPKYPLDHNEIFLSVLKHDCKDNIRIKNHDLYSYSFCMTNPYKNVTRDIYSHLHATKNYDTIYDFFDPKKYNKNGWGPYIMDLTNIISEPSMNNTQKIELINRILLFSKNSELYYQCICYAVNEEFMNYYVQKYKEDFPGSELNWKKIVQNSKLVVYNILRRRMDL